MQILFDRQPVLPGFEGCVCTFQCLTYCPVAPDGDCLWDDPLIGNEGYDFDELFEAEFHKEEFEWWRIEHDIPDEADPGGNTRRCPRCFSTSIRITEVWIVCDVCNYNEPLIDFAVGR